MSNSSCFKLSIYEQEWQLELISFRILSTSKNIQKIKEEIPNAVKTLTYV